MGETAARFLPWPGGGGHGGTIRNRSFTILHAKRPLRMEEEEQANIGDLPLGAKRSHEPSDDDGAPLVSFLAQGKKRPAASGPAGRKPRLPLSVWP